MFHKIPGNVGRDSVECSKGFWEMFKKIPGNAAEDSGECWIRFRGMLAKILENTQKDWTLYKAIDDQNITIFCTNKKFNQDVQSTDFTSGKKSPAIARHLIYHLKGMKTRTLMFWEM